MDNKTFEKLVLAALSDKIKKKDVSGHVKELTNVIEHDPPNAVAYFVKNAEFIKSFLPTYSEYVQAIKLCIQRESFGQVWSLIHSMERAVSGIDIRKKLNEKAVQKT